MLSDIGSLISKLLYTLYPPHFFNAEIADLFPHFPPLIDRIMPFYRYGSSTLGTLFLPLVVRMIIGDEQHVYPWHVYSSNLIHSYYVSLRLMEKSNKMEQKVGAWVRIDVAGHSQSFGSADDARSRRRRNPAGNARHSGTHAAAS